MPTLRVRERTAEIGRGVGEDVANVARQREYELGQFRQKDPYEDQRHNHQEDGSDHGRISLGDRSGGGKRSERPTPTAWWCDVNPFCSLQWGRLAANYGRQSLPEGTVAKEQGVRGV